MFLWVSENSCSYPYIRWSVKIKNVDRDILRRTMKFLFMGSEQAKPALGIAILLDIKVNLNHAKLRLLNVCIDIKCLMRIF